MDHIINKPVKVNQLPGLVKAIRRHGMEVGTFLVVGNISQDAVETFDQIKESFAFCRKIKVSPNISLLTAYPGSEVLEIAKKKDYLVPGFDWDDLVIQKFQLQTPLWTPQELMELVAKEELKIRWMMIFSYPKKTLLFVLERLTSDPISVLRGVARFVGLSFTRLALRH